MNRSEADAVLAVWRELLDDPADRCKYGRAVLELFHAALHYEAETQRLEQVSRLDVAHLAELGKANRDLRQMIAKDRQPEHVERDPAVPLVRPNWWMP